IRPDARAGALLYFRHGQPIAKSDPVLDRAADRGARAHRPSAAADLDPCRQGPDKAGDRQPRRDRCRDPRCRRAPLAARRRRSAGQLSEKAAWYIPSGIDQMAQPMQTAKLFKNGRSQAVRLPKEFRFEGEDVYVRRVAGGVMLSPKEPAKGEWQDFFDALDSFD